MYFTLLNICLVMFNAIGANPKKGYTLPQVVLYLITASSQWSIIYLCILYLVYKESVNITDVTNALESLFMVFHGIVKCTTLFLKRDKVRDLLERVNRFWKIEDVVDKKDKKEHLQYMRHIKTMFVLYTILCITTTLSFTCRPLFTKDDNLTFTTYRPEWIPFHVMVVYEGLMFIFGIYFPIPGLDKFILTLMLLTKMQFKMLNQEMEKVFNEMANSEGKSDHFDERIKKIVEHHDFLLDFVKRINKVFSEGMLVYVITIVLSMCVQMYIVSTQSSIKGLVYMANGLAQYIFCYCLPAQAVSDEADRTMEYAYFSRWYDNPSSTKVPQMMIIARSQKKTLILAGGIIKVDLETCLKTIRTMVSYAMFIRTMGIGQD